MEQTSVYERNAELLRRVQEGDETAEAALVEENAGLVRTVARRFLDRGTEYEDLVQIGTIGMIKAIRSFSLERGTAFSTYAVPLIVGEIRRHPFVKTRISRCFFAPPSHASNEGTVNELASDIDYYPDEYLNRLAHDGINGLWLGASFL